MGSRGAERRTQRMGFKGGLKGRYGKAYYVAFGKAVENLHDVARDDALAALATRRVAPKRGPVLPVGEELEEEAGVVVLVRLDGPRVADTNSLTVVANLGVQYALHIARVVDAVDHRAIVAELHEEGLQGGLNLGVVAVQGGDELALLLLGGLLRGAALGLALADCDGCG